MVMVYDVTPARLGDDHLGSELVEFVPQVFGLEAAADVGHVFTRYRGTAGDQGLRAHLHFRFRLHTHSHTPSHSHSPAHSHSAALRTPRLLHELLWSREQKHHTRNKVRIPTDRELQTHSTSSEEHTHTHTEN